MARRTRFHSDRNELLPLAAWPYVPFALYDRFRPPRRSAPWFDRRAVRFLERLIGPQTRILEIGAGNSTLWYARIAGRVDAIDGQTSWYERVRQDIEGVANAAIRFVPEEEIVAHLRGVAGGYDLIMLDTLDAPARVEAARVLRDNHPDAVIGVDDQDWEGHRAIDDIMAGWHVRRFAGMKSNPFAVFETDFFARRPFGV